MRPLQKPWPLSEVELVTDGDENFVRKTVHRDLGIEALRQQAIFEVADGFKIPEILDVAETGKQTVILMEYVEPSRAATPDDASSVVDTFHAATEQLIASKLFPRYTLERLGNDLEIARLYGDIPAEVNPDYFESIFDNQTVLHGDWESKQIIVNGDETAIIDFGRSLVGPRILDHAHMLRFETDGYKTCDDPDLLKASVVVDLQRMAWFELCKRNYIEYSYKEEMQAGIDGINVALGRLSVS